MSTDLLARAAEHLRPDPDDDSGIERTVRDLAAALAEARGLLAALLERRERASLQAGRDPDGTDGRYARVRVFLARTGAGNE
jgi:hypothetical protein